DEATGRFAWEGVGTVRKDGFGVRKPASNHGTRLIAVGGQEGRALQAPARTPVAIFPHNATSSVLRLRGRTWIRALKCSCGSATGSQATALIRPSTPTLPIIRSTWSRSGTRTGCS